MPESISPEERLFKVIQQAKQGPGPGKNGSPGKKKSGWLEKLKKFFSDRFGGKNAAGLKEALKDRLDRLEIQPQHINKVLAGVLAVVFLIAVYVLFQKPRDVAGILESVSRIKNVPPDRKNIDPLKEVSFYLNEIRRRDIFQAHEKAPVVETVQPAAPVAKAAQEMTLPKAIAPSALPNEMPYVQPLM